MSRDREQQGGDGDLAVERARPKLKRPPMYKVLLLNDDYTPMEFVVHVLEQFFAMNREKATQVMQVNDHSRANQHPLLCTLEEV